MTTLSPGVFVPDSARGQRATIEAALGGRNEDCRMPRSSVRFDLSPLPLRRAASARAWKSAGAAGKGRLSRLLRCLDERPIPARRGASPFFLVRRGGEDFPRGRQGGPRVRDGLLGRRDDELPSRVGGR